MDKLRAMETFIAVVECGSFTDAAARLEMSAVMVGKYIALIERQLNTRLLERNTRRQSLTDAGRSILTRRNASWSRSPSPKVQWRGCGWRPRARCG
jgi:DNA-binding transcriptional LysR family regulator